MNNEQRQFLSIVGRLPARLTTDQVAWVINAQPHDIPVLIKANLLKPLGRPQKNSVKYFCAVDVIQKANDSKWLNKVTIALGNHWAIKNRKVAISKGKDAA